MTRISRARIRSLMRIKDFAERLSNAMVLLQRYAGQAGTGVRAAAAARLQTEYSIGLAQGPDLGRCREAGDGQAVLVAAGIAARAGHDAC